jgi:hypothetical protein
VNRWWNGVIVGATAGFFSGIFCTRAAENPRAWRHKAVGRLRTDDMRTDSNACERRQPQAAAH